MANMDSSILNSTINSSVLADDADWSGEAEESSRLDILIIVFTSLILGLMILTTIIGIYQKRASDRSNLFSLNTVTCTSSPKYSHIHLKTF